MGKLANLLLPLQNDSGNDSESEDFIELKTFPQHQLAQQAKTFLEQQLTQQAP
jgi:hypothetical protein